MKHGEGFYRITFDTNPNDCNLNCIMCEHHSKYSNIEKDRICAKQPKIQMPIGLIQKILKDTKDSPFARNNPVYDGRTIVI